MSKPIQLGSPTEPTTTESARLDLQQHIQRGIVLATQLHHAASKEDLNSKEWTANQAATNELLRIFSSMQGKTVTASEAMEGLIAAQIKAEIQTRMDKLQNRLGHPKIHPELYAEIRDYLSPSQSGSRERIVKLAVEKMKGVSPTADLGAIVTEAAEAALLEEFHKGIDKQMRGYMR